MPLPGTAVKSTASPVQMTGSDALICNVGITPVFTVMVIVFELAVAGEAQASPDVTIAVTWSPLDKAPVVKLAAFVPVLTPFTCPWYKGVAPALTGVAINVTGVPLQTVVEAVVSPPAVFGHSHNCTRCSPAVLFITSFNAVRWSDNGSYRYSYNIGNNIVGC